jgi:hypothetical protein
MLVIYVGYQYYQIKVFLYHKNKIVKTERMYSNTSPEKVNIHYPDVNRQQNLYPVVSQIIVNPKIIPRASRYLIIVS